MPTNTNNKKVASFIENVNTVANATRLASNDTIEDAQIAAKEAKNWAEKSLTSATESREGELLSMKWATSEYNIPVDTGPGGSRFSSMHWSIQAHMNSGEVVIDDADINHPSSKTTWSSSIIKIFSSILPCLKI